MARVSIKFKLVGFTISRLVIERDALRFNGDTVRVRVHGVEPGLPFHDQTGHLQIWIIRSDSVDLPWSMSNDRKVTYVLHIVK